MLQNGGYTEDYKQGNGIYCSYVALLYPTFPDFKGFMFLL